METITKPMQQKILLPSFSSHRPIIADLHIHSKYAQGTSKNLDLDTLEKYARLKGVDLLGTGDFTHPQWIKELKAHLKEDGSGILKTSSGFRFVLQTEISLVYTQGGRGRRIHLVVLAPDFASVDAITRYLLQFGRVDYDGRPIFKITARDFVASLHAINPKIEVIPAHVWTPWFGLFGSKSGFDSVEEAFQDKTHLIHALETGLSSDPPMNWRLSSLDGFQLVSFSDLHSYWPWRMSREATLFAKADRYDDLLEAIRTGNGLLGTIEVDPGYGKYHYDGHRNCGIRLTPEETKTYHGVCPVCGNPLTIGVEFRVEELADRPVGFQPKGAKPFYRLLPLSEILAAYYQTKPSTKKVWQAYYRLVENTSEYDVLLFLSKEELLKRAEPAVVEAILQNRAGAIAVDPGFDGVYGVPLIFNNQPQQFSPENLAASSSVKSFQEAMSPRSQPKKQMQGQKKLFDF